jgi:hypothetical protein
MCKKQQDLAMNHENLAKVDVVEIELFSCSVSAQGRGKKRGKNRGGISLSY